MKQIKERNIDNELGRAHGGMEEEAGNSRATGKRESC